MTNVVFDMNNMFFRSLYVLGGFGQKQFTFDNKEELDSLIRKLSMDISFLIRLINPSRVIFAVDDKSWRKDIYIEENEGYKGHRTQSKMINWVNLYSALDEFMDIVQDNGMIVTKIKNAEADDSLSLWRDELLYNQKQHVILVSGDEDIRQLVTHSIDDKGKKIFSTVFNPFMQGKNAARKLYVPENIFNRWMDDIEVSDIWNMDATIDVDKRDFDRIRNTEKIRVEEVNGNEIAMRKIFCGDDGDNIPSIYTWMTKTGSGNDKEVRITNSKYVKIIKGIENSPGELIKPGMLIKRKDKIFNEIKKICEHTPTFKIEERLKRQIKLVLLDCTIFPIKIVETFHKMKKEELLKPRPEIANINMYTMLQGTSYVKTSKRGSYNGNEASIFKDLDKLPSKKLF